nr:hypothetical protein [Tanacetum cinerariifolium]
QARGVNYKKGNMNDKQSAQFGYQHIKHNDSPKKTTEKPSGESGVNKESNSGSKIEQPKNTPNKKAWSVHGDILAAVKRDESLSVCAILETHIKSKRLQDIGDRIFGNWEWYSNMQYCDKGCRIMLGWNGNTVDLRIIHSAKQSMLCEIVSIGTEKSVFCAFIYAANGGDMNVTLAPNEHSAGGSRMTSDMEEFKDCVNNIEVEDITSSGLFYTWTKNLFKVVWKQWDEEHDGCDMFRTVKKKLKSLKRDLKKLAWKDGNFFENVKQLRDQLKDIQAKIDKEPNKKELRIDEAKILEDYAAAMKDEEKLLCQKAKVKWLSEGDRNNTFFHKVLKSRSHKSKINNICDDLGNCYTGKDVANQFVKHFESFLGNDSSVTDLSTISALFQKKLSVKEAQFMVRELGMLLEVMFAMLLRNFFASGKLLKEINSTLISLVLKIQTPCKVNDFRPIACCNVIYKCISKLKESLGMLVDENQSAFVPNRHIQDNILLLQELLRGYDRKEGPNRVAMKVDIQKAYDTVNWQFLEAILKEFGFHEKMVGWIVKCVTSVSFSICVNGERFGYFKGGRGLRQGDPMSPYLFTLVMEVLTLIVKDKVEKNKNFRFHFGCKKLKLTHVCFGDDLLMFYNGDMESVKALKEAIEEFGAFSGLNLITTRVLLSLARIGVSNCKVLLDKVKGRISNRKNKYLSYAGRDTSKGNAKVAWKNICRPKCQGGLGLKEPSIWNKAMITKHLWNVAMGKESMWVKWISVEKLKGRSVWAINEEANDSWGWKNILKLRNEVRSNFVMKIGNGEKASVVYDNWSDIGILQSFISQRDIYDVRLNANVVVKDFVANGLMNRSQKIKWDYNKLIWDGMKWDTSKGNAKVAWKNICRPKCQGGLGLKELSIWNKAMITKRLWNVAMGKESMWVISVEKLKGRSVWAINEEANDISVVYDNWSDIGILQSFISQRDIYDARLNANSTISLDKHKENKLVWRSNNGAECLFSVDLSCLSAIVKWKSLV